MSQPEIPPLDEMPPEPERLRTDSRPTDGRPNELSSRRLQRLARDLDLMSNLFLGPTLSAGVVIREEVKRAVGRIGGVWLSVLEGTVDGLVEGVYGPTEESIVATSDGSAAPSPLSCVPFAPADHDHKKTSIFKVKVVSIESLGDNDLPVTHVVTESLSWAVIRLQGLRARVLGCLSDDVELLFEEFRIGGSPNLFLVDSWVNIRDLPERASGLRAFPVVTAPNTAMMRVIAVYHGPLEKPPETVWVECSVMAEIMIDNAFGSGLPGAYARPGGGVVPLGHPNNPGMAAAIDRAGDPLRPDGPAHNAIRGALRQAVDAAGQHEFGELGWRDIIRPRPRRPRRPRRAQDRVMGPED